MKVSLPDDLKTFVDAQADERGYVSNSEFIRELIRLEQDRTQLRALLLRGLESELGSEMDDDYFERMRESIRDSAQHNSATGLNNEPSRL